MSSEEIWRAEHPNHGRNRPVGEGGPWTRAMEACWLVLPDSELSKDGKLREITKDEIYAEFDATDKGKMEMWNAKMLKHKKKEPWQDTSIEQDTGISTSTFGQQPNKTGSTSPPGGITARPGQ